jgi:hypothetical protein
LGLFAQDITCLKAEFAVPTAEQASTTKVPQSAPEKTAGQAAPLPIRPKVDMVSSPLVASSLDVNAPPFYPSAMWYPSITDEYYREHPHSPGKSGFVLADSGFTLQEIPDEELFDPTYYPMTADEMLELEQVDEINEMLAELEIMESHQELHHKITVKTRDLRSNSDVDAEIRSLMAKASKVNDYEAQAQKKKGFHSHHTPLHQPRSVK